MNTSTHFSVSRGWIKRGSHLHLFVACHEPVMKLHVMWPEWRTVGFLANTYYANLTLTINVVLATDCTGCAQWAFCKERQWSPDTKALRSYLKCTSSNGKEVIIIDGASRWWSRLDPHMTSGMTLLTEKIHWSGMSRTKSFNKPVLTMPDIRVRSREK